MFVTTNRSANSTTIFPNSHRIYLFTFLNLHPDGDPVQVKYGGSKWKGGFAVNPQPAWPSVGGKGLSFCALHSLFKTSLCYCHAPSAQNTCTTAVQYSVFHSNRQYFSTYSMFHRDFTRLRMRNLRKQRKSERILQVSKTEKVLITLPRKKILFPGCEWSNSPSLCDAASLSLIISKHGWHRSHSVQSVHRHVQHHSLSTR